LAFTAGHHPMPRMSFGPALSLGFASLGEYLDLDLTAFRTAAEVMHLLNGELPDGLVVLEADRQPLNGPTIDRALRGFSYTVSLAHLPRGRVTDEGLRARIAAFEAAAAFPILKTIKGRTRQIDARASVQICRIDPQLLRVETAVTRGGTLKPHHVVATLLGLSDMETQLLEVTKVGTLLATSADVPPAPVTTTLAVDTAG
jgi:radical SAM-linked protein